MIHPYVKLRPEARVPALHKVPRTYQRGYAAPLGKDHHHETKRGPESLTSSSVATIETATSQSDVHVITVGRSLLFILDSSGATVHRFYRKKEQKPQY